MKKFSAATKMIVAAIKGSTTDGGRRTISRTARQRVSEWARVNAVTTLISGHRLRPHRITARRNAMWS